MSLIKAIISGKEHRISFRGSKAIDPTCRNHGSCVWCKRNRMYNKNKTNSHSLLDMKEAMNG